MIPWVKMLAAKPIDLSAVLRIRMVGELSSNLHACMLTPI